MGEERGSGAFFRDIGTILALLIPFGTLFHKALFSGQNIWFKISFTCLIVSLIVAVHCFWWSAKKRALWHSDKFKEKAKLIAPPLASLMLIFVFGVAAYITTKQPEVEIKKALELHEILINSFSGYRIGIIGKVKRWGTENYIPKDSELRYRLVRLKSGSTEKIYKQLQPSGSKLTIVDGVEPGIYDVRLVFYGLILDRSGSFEVGKKVTHIVYLNTPSHDIEVFFKIKHQDGSPLKGVWVEVVGPGYQHIRGEPDHSITTDSGITKKPLWLPPLPSKETQNYIALIRRGNEQIIAKKQFRIEGATEFWDKRELEIVLNTNNTMEGGVQ